ncbi:MULTISPECIES: T4 family baseplate hub assembly chaperone [Niastella]|uniref:Phage baseplate protein n=1 Tax=Niastella soli TaxID=2821487 RepID=A0ABS3Z5Q5_9BACT|nr:hypothetical protein [Niastella soli]MBO9205492.1 hypothetical protein [Niastella soli]
MRPLTTVELLNIWEAGIHQTLMEKSLHLVTTACSLSSIHEAANLPIGERDHKLLQLREWMFGSRLINTMNCPSCNETVEWETDLRELYLQTAHDTTASREYNLESDGFNIRFRLPNSGDLLNAILNNASNLVAQKVLAGCILEARRDQNTITIDELPNEVFTALNQHLGKEDPQADIWMLLTCPYCSHQWEGQFDIVSYLWIEIDNWAKHMLHEVYLLATTFGWSEYDILNLSPQRRQLYLEMIRS